LGEAQERRTVLSFLTASIRSIQEWAGELEGWQAELEFVPFAAHLFAVGTQLLLNEGSARLMVRLDLPAPRTDLELLRRDLAEVSGTADGPALYRTIIAALITIESVLLREPSLAAALPPFTDLTPLELETSSGEEVRGIGGRVYHWIRPASALAALRMLRIDHAKSHPPDPMPHPGIYLDRLSLYWDSDPQLPRLTRVQSNSRIAPFFRDSGDDAAIRKRFRLALCPLEGPFYPRFSLKGDGRFFQAHPESPMQGAAELKDHLETVIKAATDEKKGINLILFPELTVDAIARSSLEAALLESSRVWSSLYGVVAGSFHFLDGASGAAAGPELPPVNETVFLDRTGKRVMAHRKKGRFRVTPSKVSPKFFADSPVKGLHKEIFEDIRYGSELSLIDTSLGRLAVLICADAIAADDRGYLPLIRRLRPDLLLVISMSAETEPFEAFAEEMSHYWIGTVFVNAHCILAEVEAARAALEAQQAAARESQGADGLKPSKEDRSPHLAAWNLALYEAEGCPPTRGRWKFGHEPECLYFKESERRKKGWHALSQDPDPNGISLLRSEDQTLGLVLDLGVHWQD
jgi:predicted amidohydrolase